VEIIFSTKHFLYAQRPLEVVIVPLEKEAPIQSQNMHTIGKVCM